MRVSNTREGLDREHNAPEVQRYEVSAPYGLNSSMSLDWAMEQYGDLAHCIECLGVIDGRYRFMVSPKWN